MHHWTSNHVVIFDAENPDIASGEADVKVAIHHRDGTWHHGGGTYLDEYVRSDGQWRISCRRVSGTFVSPLQASPSPPTEASRD